MSNGPSVTRPLAREEKSRKEKKDILRGVFIRWDIVYECVRPLKEPLWHLELLSTVVA